jgi:hypothetical protein
MPASTRTRAAIYVRRTIARRIEQPAALPGEQNSPRRLHRRLWSAIARIVQCGANHDERTFFRLEYRDQNCPPSYTTAREDQQQSELLGPPPLSL